MNERKTVGKCGKNAGEAEKCQPNMPSKVIYDF